MSRLSARIKATLARVSTIALAFAVAGTTSNVDARPIDLRPDAPLLPLRPESAPSRLEITPPTWRDKIEQRLADVAAQIDRTHDTAQPFVPSPQTSKQLERLAREAAVLGEVGVSVRDLQSGLEVFAWQPDQPLNPASNNKLVTASAAVALLGPDFRFETRLARHGDALYLVGGGDPSLQVEDLEAMTSKLAPADLAGVHRLVVDDSMFSARRFGPGYEKNGTGPAYMAPSGALSLQFNTVEITVRPGIPGQRPHVHISPNSPYIDTVLLGGSERSSHVTSHEADLQTVIAVRGTPSEPVHTRRRVAHPALFTGHTFAQRLPIADLELVTGTVPKNATTLMTHRSAPLVEVLGSALKYSNNFTTEQILRTLGYLYSGEPGDWNNGREVVMKFWEAIGEDPNTLIMENAAGLSAHGRVSAQGLARLTQVWNTHAVSPVVEAMPIAGREGTLRNRLDATRGRVRAKTGTLAQASALTGVIEDALGHPRLGFSILVNGTITAHRARRMQDRMVMALVRDLS